MSVRVSLINSLDSRYGSTYRLRGISRALQKIEGIDASYFETEGSPLQKLIFALRAAWVQSDVVILQKFNPITLAAGFLAHFRSERVIFDWDDFDAGLQNSSIKRWIAAFCESIGPRFFRQITTHNQLIEKRVRDLGGNPLYLAQGYDPDLFRVTKEARKAVRKLWGVQEDQYLIGHLCTFTHGGTLDLSVILNAFQRLPSDHFLLVLIGGGPQEAEVQKELEKRGLLGRTRITGLIAQEEVAQILNALDMGIVFMRDSLGNRGRVSLKVIEYLATGLPVVGQVIQDSDQLFGSSIVKSNEENLAEMIQKTAKHKITRETPAFLQEFSWDRVILPLANWLLESKRN